MNKLFSIALLWLPLTALAQDKPAPEVVEKVEVAGVRDPEFKTYRKFSEAMDAFDEHRALAPSAALRFRLMPNKPDSTLDGVTIRIAGNESSVPVPVDSTGLFVLPRSQSAFDEDAEIMLNRKKGSFRWRVDVRSPNLPDKVARLGDLRLACRVTWVIIKDTLSFFQRAAVGTLGFCTSKSVRFFHPAPRPITGFALVHGERREPSHAKAITAEGKGFAVPLYDKSWPDDTLIEFDYAPQP